VVLPPRRIIVYIIYIYIYTIILRAGGDVC
jgi:hypothetical protein